MVHYVCCTVFMLFGRAIGCARSCRSLASCQTLRHFWHRYRFASLTTNPSRPVGPGTIATALTDIDGSFPLLPARYLLWTFAGLEVTANWRNAQYGMDSVERPGPGTQLTKEQQLEQVGLFISLHCVYTVQFFFYRQRKSFKWHSRTFWSKWHFNTAIFYFNDTFKTLAKVSHSFFYSVLLGLREINILRIYAMKVNDLQLQLLLLLHHIGSASNNFDLWCLNLCFFYILSPSFSLYSFYSFCFNDRRLFS